jgi:hypothetical protein|tara:strand:- start:715 stop:915 length:201 start_codon:yes stop_codon:yes gene_type:complete
MSDKYKKVTESFSKDLLDLCNKYMLLGLSKVDQCSIILNVFTGIFISLVFEIDRYNEEDNDDETIH